MIYLTRPVIETHKPVQKTMDKSLDNNFSDRKPIEQNLKGTESQGRKKDLKKEELEKAVEETNHIIFKDDNRFEFKVHERTGRIMVKLINKETEEVVKEIPPEKILDLVASIWDLVGILVDERG